MFRDLLSATITDDPLANFMLEAGGIVSGAVALGATFGFVTGSIAKDLGVDVDLETWTRRCGSYAGVAGLTVVISRAVGE